MPDSYGPGAASKLRRAREANVATTDYAVTPGTQLAEGSLPDWFHDSFGHIGLFPIRAYGIGSAADTFKFRLLGAWAQSVTTDGIEAVVYDIAVIAEFTATLGNTTGTAAMTVLNTERYAWSLGTASGGPVAEAYADALPVIENGADADGDNAIAYIKDMGQPDKIGFDFDIDAGAGGTPTSANALFRFIS